MPTTLAELARLVQGQVRGNPDLPIARANALDRALADEVTYVAGAQHRDKLAVTRAGAVILAASEAERFAGNAIVVDNPQLAFARICAHLHPVIAPPAGVHPSAVVDPGARIASSAIIGARAVVGADAVIEAGAWVGPGCVVGSKVRIGERSRLMPGVVVHDDCVIGRDCLVLPGAVIGSDGFGFARDGSRWVRQPQLGRVIIGDEVEIGANTTIDRGTFGDT